MKTHTWKSILFCALGACLNVHGQGTAFTYQGRLNDGGAPAAGNYDLTFSLFNASSGGSSAAGTVTNSVSITNGLFTAQLDFGAAIFNGTTYWLQIGVRTNGAGSFTTLTSRQQLTPAPYAIYSSSAASATSLSGSVPSGGLSGTYTNAVVLNNAANTFTGNGSGITGVNASQLNGLAASNFWKTAGNGGTSPTNGNFLGTTDGQPLELRVNGVRALRLQPPATNGSPSIVGGSIANFIGANVVGATIAGGGSTNENGSQGTNSINANYAFIGGGAGHIINAGSDHALIAGGFNNLVDSNSFASAIVGGAQNSIFQNTDHSYIGGGYFNIIIPFFGSYDTISGGENNSISGAFLNDAVIGGGSSNKIQSGSATIAGGAQNTASGFASAVGGGNQNSAGGQNTTVAGGNSNQANGDRSTVGGGLGNVAYGAADTLAGGINNSSGGGNVSTISGGENNNSSGSDVAIGGGAYNSAAATFSVISGGASNTVSADFAAVSGGYSNNATGLSSFVAGGELNVASADRSFAAGSAAQAQHFGAFVWADFSSGFLGAGVPLPFASSNANEFAARATGGVRFVTAINSATAAPTAGVSLAPGGTSWATISDRNAKKDFAPVDSELILDKLSSVPVQQWHYKWEDAAGARNIGPMAQDFIHAFYPGRNDKSITTLEFDGVELAAIQALNEKLKTKDAEIENLKSRLEQLEHIVKQQNPNLEVKP